MQESTLVSSFAWELALLCTRKYMVSCEDSLRFVQGLVKTCYAPCEDLHSHARKCFLLHEEVNFCMRNYLSKRENKSGQQKNANKKIKNKETSTPRSTRSMQIKEWTLKCTNNKKRGTSIHLNHNSKKHTEINIAVNKRNIAMYINNIITTKQPN